MPGCLLVVMGWRVLSELNQHLGKAATLLLCSSSKNNVRRRELAHELPPLRRNDHQETNEENQTRLHNILLPPLSLSLQ